VRPEKIALFPAGAPTGPDARGVDGVVREVAYLGMYTRYRVEAEGASYVVVDLNRAVTRTPVAVGTAVRLEWPCAAERPLA
jgi:hypothetical protein